MFKFFTVQRYKKNQFSPKKLIMRLLRIVFFINIKRKTGFYFVIFKELATDFVASDSSVSLFTDCFPHFTDFLFFVMGIIDIFEVRFY
jgi:hypothetical protein